MSDNIITPKNKGQVEILDNNGRVYPAIVVYTTDGNGNVSPVSGGGGGGGGDASAANQVIEISKLTSIDGKTPTLIGGKQPVIVSNTDSSVLVSGASAVGIAPSLNPVSVSGVDGGGLKRHLLTDSTGKIEINSVQSLPLPTGAATEATLQAIDAGIPTSLGAKTTANSMSVNIASDQTVPVSASSLPLPTGAATSANQSTTNASLSSIDGKLTNAATTTLQTTGNASLASIDSKITMGQQPAASSMAMALANENVQDLSFIGQAAQTAVINNIIPPTASSNATDATGYRMATVQIVSTAAVGNYNFEGSNDNVNFHQITFYDPTIITGSQLVSQRTCSVGSISFIFPIHYRYIRCRITTTVTGGSIQAFTKLSQTTFSPALMQVAQSTSGNLNVTAVGQVQLNAPTNTSDLASSALTTTATTGTLSPSNGAAQVYQFLVTAVTGTSPTLDVQVQESQDAGTNWYPVYDFPRITTTGAYSSPMMPITGNRVRYVQTVAGTTPSFTRSINRIMSSANVTPIRQQIDRTVVLTTLSSTTPSLLVDVCKNLKLVINIGTTTVAPAVQLQESEDGINYTLIGTPLTAVASSSVTYTLNNVNAKYVRGIVTTAGTSTVMGYVLIKGF